MRFEDLNLKPLILKKIREEGFLEPTEIQQKCIPEIKKGRDVVGQAMTGSGKTVAFSIPVIEAVIPGRGVQALVLTPTRELCVQVCDTFHTFGKALGVNATAIYGGTGMEQQYSALKRADVVVATPGRLLDHMRRNSINLSRLKFLVLDEMDKMLDMGFIDDVDTIIRNVPKSRQTMLFSATMPESIHSLISRYLQSPVILKAQAKVDKSLLKQIYYVVEQHEKFSLLVHLLTHKTSGFAMVFCGTRHQVDAITRNLQKNGINSMAIHGGLTQNRRMHALNSLKSADIDVLVATDVAARGLDIKNVTHVYNFDAPKTPEEYTHRVGRTARAGKAGDAITLLAHRDFENFDRVLRDRTIEVKKEELPDFKRIPFRAREEGRFARGGHSGARPRRSFGAQRFPKRERWRDG
ncbi:putative ATP-dependent RNA helicase [uncultured archaeon]|nr:putative ATP-dependent RNA helicase [uncultured archaeon]